jgi:hypothetical protein
MFGIKIVKVREMKLKNAAHGQQARPHDRPDARGNPKVLLLSESGPSCRHGPIV